MSIVAGEMHERLTMFSGVVVKTINAHRKVDPLSVDPLVFNIHLSMITPTQKNTVHISEINCYIVKSIIFQLFLSCCTKNIFKIIVLPWQH
jgi:hypothetical protein